MSRRERQIMDILFQRGRASVAEVLAALPDPPSYSAVRALLRILEEKGHAKHVEEEGKYFYLPAHPRRAAAKEALTQVLNTFFEGSLESAVAALLSSKDAKLSDDELERLSRLIEDAKRSEG